MLYARLSCAVLVVGLSVFGSQATALAGNSGALYRDVSGDNGVRATLTGSANLGGTNAAIISTVRVEKNIFGSSNGLYQAGWLKQGSDFLSSCGSGAINGTMVERHHDTPSENFLCNTYFGLGNYGDTYQYRIKHVSSGWETIKENGAILDGPYDLGFAGGGSIAVSEKYNTITSASMTFGPSGGTDWQRYDSYFDFWYTISTADKINNGGWTIGDAPSPFTISR